MNTKILAITIVFAALTVALALLHAEIPAPYMPFLKYNLWEIPIVAALLIAGPLSALVITFLNAGMLLAFDPGPLPTGPFYNLVAIVSTLAGVYIAYRFFKSKEPIRKNIFKVATAATALGIFLRIIVMTLVNYVTLRYPYPIGFGMQEIEIVAFLPVGALFNGTLALYTIPIGEFIYRVAKNTLKIGTLK
jgi:riboflavin transporter FmnP